MTREGWLAAVTAWCGSGALPARCDVGTLYPWRAVALHATTVGFKRRVREAAAVLADARAMDIDWRASISGGKDSTALAVLLAESGWRVSAVSVKDDLDYPSERAYVEALCDRLGLSVDILVPPSLRAFLAASAVSLTTPQHGRQDALSDLHFYGLLNGHRAQHGYRGVLMGLRAAESRGRAVNAAVRGAIYTRGYDGLTVGQPLRRWTALDVHAYLHTRCVPLLPCYLCVDSDADPFAIRKSWWVVGGLPATIGSHYAWLRRWWPDLYQLAAEIDPTVRALS